MTVRFQDTRICNLTLFIVETRSVLLTQKRHSSARLTRLLQEYDQIGLSRSLLSLRRDLPVFLVLLIIVLTLGLSSLRTTRPGFAGGSSPEVGIVPRPGGVNVTGTTCSSGRILCECATAISSVGLDRTVFMTSMFQDTRSVRVLMQLQMPTHVDTSPPTVSHQADAARPNHRFVVARDLHVHRSR